MQCENICYGLVLPNDIPNFTGPSARPVSMTTSLTRIGSKGCPAQFQWEGGAQGGIGLIKMNLCFFNCQDTITV